MSCQRLAGIALAVFLLSLSLAVPSLAAGEEAWCGDSSTDWACRETGKVEVRGHSMQERPVPANSLIATFPHAEARITFASEAWCTLGGSGVASSMLTRPPGEGTLFRLSTGSSICWNPSGEGAIEVLCVKGERCPVEVEARGVSLIRVFPDGVATASSVSVVHHTARIISCGGFVRVAFHSEGPGSNSPAEASGTGSYGQPFEVFVDQTIESSDGFDESGFRVKTTTRTRTLERPGLCGSEPIQEVNEAATETRRR